MKALQRTKSGDGPLVRGLGYLRHVASQPGSILALSWAAVLDPAALAGPLGCTQKPLARAAKRLCARQLAFSHSVLLVAIVPTVELCCGHSGIAGAKSLLNFMSRTVRWPVVGCFLKKQMSA